MPLTNTAVRNAKPGAKPTKLFDARGLFLMVTPAGGKWWRLRYRYDDKEKLLSLGVYPDVGLKEARERLDQLRKQIANGIDPSEYVKTERAVRRAAKAGQIVVTRFIVDNDGALTFRLGNRRLTLTPAETSELRGFLDATRAVVSKVNPCL